MSNTAIANSSNVNPNTIISTGAPGKSPTPNDSAKRKAITVGTIVLFLIGIAIAGFIPVSIPFVMIALTALAAGMTVALNKLDTIAKEKKAQAEIEQKALPTLQNVVVSIGSGTTGIN